MIVRGCDNGRAVIVRGVFGCSERGCDSEGVFGDSERVVIVRGVFGGSEGGCDSEGVFGDSDGEQ